MRVASRTTALPCICALLLLAAGSARGQVIPDAVIVGAEIGTGLYLGEFNTLQYEGGLGPNFGTDLSGSLRYNIAQSFSLIGQVGRTTLSYDVSQANRIRYGARFFGAATDSLYPGTGIRITDRNRISINRYLLFARSHFMAESQFVPYFTLGLGLIDFSVKNNEDMDLPDNITGDYEKLVMVMPVGGGAEYHFNERFGMYAQGLFYVNSTDYLDGYAHYLDFESGEVSDPVGPGLVETPPDYFITFDLGFSIAVYVPEVEESSAPPESRPDYTSPAWDREPQPEDTSSYSEDTPLDPRGDTAQASPRTEPTEKIPAPGGSSSDTDGDGLNDEEEQTRYMTDPLKADSDGDNLGDADEIRNHNTSPNNKDTDSDGLSDGMENIVYGTNPLTSDSDRDGLKDGQEIRLYKTNPLDTDTDDDRLRDGVEVTRMFTNPLYPDTDGDGVMDGDDQCPHISGDMKNNGCPKGMAPSSYSEKIRESGPLKGLPEVPLEGDRTDFAGIYFRVNSDDFDLSRPETSANLQKLLSYMRQCEEIGVVVEGHTSSEGNPRWNQQLSEMRARRVRDWLLANGIDQEKILGTVGYGSQMPKIPEPKQGSVPGSLLEQIRKQNRRITTLVKETCR